MKTKTIHLYCTPITTYMTGLCRYIEVKALLTKRTIDVITVAPRK